VRIFLDTNVLAAAVATRGVCSEVFEAVVENHDLLTCQAVLSELQRVLRAKFRLQSSIIERYISLLKSEAVLVGPGGQLSVRIKDADDVPIIACAVAGRADCFVTGDKEILEHRSINGVSIVSPRQMWNQLAGLT
jgi:putative PIN family toxin of toxin-antitoxin system